MLKIGDKMPSFEVVDQDGNAVTLARIRETKRSAVTLDDGTLLPVGESYRDQAWSRIGKKST